MTPQLLFITDYKIIATEFRKIPGQTAFDTRRPLKSQSAVEVRVSYREKGRLLCISGENQGKSTPLFDPIRLGLAPANRTSLLTHIFNIV